MQCSSRTAGVNSVPGQNENRRGSYRIAVISFHVKKVLGGRIFLCRDVVHDFRQIH